MLCLRAARSIRISTLSRHHLGPIVPHLASLRPFSASTFAMSVGQPAPEGEPPLKKIKTMSEMANGDAAPGPHLESATASEEMVVEEIMKQPMEVRKSYEYEIDYRDKLVLAPMVRSGTLPARLLALHYGAGLVWSPEIVDRAIIGATRTVDERTGVITYSKGQGAIFTTHPCEKPYLIYQIGSSDPDLALQAAKTVQQDVSGIDLNCGCPKPFSTHAGMGAALLSTPDILIAILRNLINNIPIPISCKIRLLPTQPDTLQLVARLLKTGIRNLSVHCRTRNMRSSEKALWDRLSDVVKLGRERGVPVTCNGDGEGWSNWAMIKEKTGADSLMIARAAEKNPSIFAAAGPRSNVEVVLPQLLQLASHLEHHWANTKFLALQYHPTGSGLSKAEKKRYQDAIQSSKSVQEVATKLGIDLAPGKDLMDRIIQELQKGEKVDTSVQETVARIEERSTPEEPEEELRTPEKEPEVRPVMQVQHKATVFEDAEVDEEKRMNG